MSVSSPSERFHVLTESNPDAVALMDADGLIVYANRSTSRVLNYAPEELVGRSSLDLLHPQDRVSSAQLLRKLAAKPYDPQRLEVRFLQKDGRSVWVEAMAANLLQEPSVGAIVMSYREITQRRAEEEMLRRLNQQLARSNEELQAFAHTAAHDLIEPLRTISALLELLAQKLPLNAKDQQIADLILAGTIRMSVLLEDLLMTASSGHADTPQPVALANAASQAVANLRQAIEASGGKVEVDTLPAVIGNPSGLIRLFQNLLSNALKYRGAEAPLVRISSVWRGALWLITIQDNGVGIAKQDHQRVFEPFTRLLPRHADGTGIGLATCKKIVQDMGGTIWVESEPGRGAAFCFTARAADAAG